MKIVVVGIGYVGLSNAIILAQYNNVVAVDLDIEKIEKINSRISPIKDKEIEHYFKTKKLNLRATNDGINEYVDADYVLISTPTNYDPDSNHFDTSSVESVIKDVLSVNKKCFIIIKSTVGIGFTKKISNEMKYNNIIFSPEFLREGRALYDNLYPSRIVVGLLDASKESNKKARKFIDLLKQGALKKRIPVFITGTTEAEAVKLFSNTYLALRVAYFNELDTFALKTNLNAKDIISAVCSDKRIGNFYNNPSFGYGGYCLPKDTRELKANFNTIPENLISAVVDSNLTRKKFIANNIIDFASKINAKAKTIGIYRLTMKTGSDNFRQSAIRDIIDLLKRRKFNVIIFEPILTSDFFEGCSIINDIEKFKTMSDVIVSNRVDNKMTDVRFKLYTRDIFERD